MIVLGSQFFNYCCWSFWNITEYYARYSWIRLSIIIITNDLNSEIETNTCKIERRSNSESVKTGISSDVWIVETVNFSELAKLSIIDEYGKSCKVATTVVRWILPRDCHAWYSCCNSYWRFCLRRRGTRIERKLSWLWTISVEVNC